MTFHLQLGRFYQRMTEWIGYKPGRDEHKTQWLSLGGEPAFEKLFLEMFRRAPAALPHPDYSYFNRGLAGHIAFSKKFYGRLGIEPPASSGAPQGLRRTELGETLRRQ